LGQNETYIFLRHWAVRWSYDFAGDYNRPTSL